VVHLPLSPFDGKPVTLLEQAVLVARTYVGVRETKGEPNRGPEVDRFLRTVGLDPEKGAYSWCAAFCYTVYKEAAEHLGVVNPCPKTAGVLKMWERSPVKARVLMHEARDNPSLIRPGALYVADHGHGKGHIEIVTAVIPSAVKTIGGNTNGAGSREGDGVYFKERPIASALGFVDFGR
jgi:hypothetical protein